MKPIIPQQEIVIFTSTHFSHREWCEDTKGASARNETENHRLEEACWNGMLPEMLPEILLKQAGGRPLYLWNILKETNCLKLDLGLAPLPVESCYSIDPHICGTTNRWN